MHGCMDGLPNPPGVNLVCCMLWGNLFNLSGPIQTNFEKEGSLEGVQRASLVKSKPQDIYEMKGKVSNDEGEKT